MQIAVYVTHETLYGTRSTRDELRNELRSFALVPLMTLLSALNEHLRSEDGKPDPAIQKSLLPLFFSNDEITRMYQLEPDHFPIVLHRQQLIFLMKEATQSCGDTGVILTTDFRPLGKALLQANDWLGHKFPRAQTFHERCLVAAAHFFAIQEAGSFHSFEYKILRSYLMLNKTLPTAVDRQPYFDVPKLFTEASNMQLADFQILQFMTMTCFTKEVSKLRATSPIELPESWFRHTDFAQPDLNAYLSYVSSSPSELTTVIAAQSDPSDFTAFRDKPLLRVRDRLILIDYGFLTEKFESGPFWSARKQVPNDQAIVYFSFWGDLFERYISQILEVSCGTTRNLVYPDPKFVDGKQFTDCAVLSGRSLVMVEAKSSTISARTKYGGDLRYLDRTIRRNFVEENGSPKALRQLVRGISKFFRDGTEVNGLNARGIDRIFPVIVTRDDVGGTVGIGPLLNELFEKILQEERLKLTQSITPLICLSAEDLERTTPVLREVGLDSVLEGYLKGCRETNSKLKPFRLTQNRVLRKFAGNNLPDKFKESLKELADKVESRMKVEQADSLTNSSS